MAPGYLSYNKVDTTASLTPNKSLLAQQNAPNIESKSLNVDSSRQFIDENQINDESGENQHQEDLEEELIPIFTFRKYNNRRGNHSNKGRMDNFNWPWFGNLRLKNILKTLKNLI